MKSLESCEPLWRDGIHKQCIYGVLIGVMIMASVHIGLVQPKQERIHYLLDEVTRLERLSVMSVQEEMMDVVSASEQSCSWEKGMDAWRMTGDFTTVYDCVLHEENTRVVDSMRLQKHMMGVSVVLGFNEMPA
ncbi:MAG: hypothetical protein ACHQAX_00390 [Gammaproteobacteria bacterium]